MAGSPSQLTARAKYPKAKKTAIAPTSAPMSGRVSNRASGPTLTTRSSGGAFGAAVSAMAVNPLRWGGRPEDCPPHLRLASSLCCERRHFGGFRLFYVARAGKHRCAVPVGVEVRHVEHGEHDRQINLQVLLLVDREQHLPLLDLLDRAAD